MQQMKAIGLMFAVFAALAWLLTPAMAVEPDERLVAVMRRLDAGQRQTVVVYGTSLTHGGAWAEATRDWFEQRYPGQVTFVNSGGPGRNSDWGVEHLGPRVLQHAPDLVFVEFSYNDAHVKFKMPVDRGAANLSTIVERIGAANPQAAIVLQTMTSPWDATADNPPATSRPQLDAFNDNYRRFAETHHVPLLDHDRAWSRLRDTDRDRYEAYLPDGSHPTREGSLAITWPAVRELLESARSRAEGGTNTTDG